MTSSKPPKAPTIKDVALYAGVSFKTVSRVMNHHPSVNPGIRKAVEEAMRALDYRPHQAARALRSQRSYSIALLTSWTAHAPQKSTSASGSETHFVSEFLNQLTLGCGVGAQESGYHLIYEIVTHGDRPNIESSVSALLRNLKPDGVILLPPLCDIPWLLDLLEDHDVRYARLLPGTDLQRGISLVIDDFEAAEKLTGLFLSAGHRRLAMIAGPDDHIAAKERRKAFELAIAKQPEALGVVRQGDFSVTSGRKEALELLRSPDRPTAIFAANDAMALGAMSAASELGLSIPRDLSLVGFDDSTIARITTPPLTSVRQPAFDIAVKAMKMLAKAADGGLASEPQLIQLDYSISERESIAPPPPVT